MPAPVHGAGLYLPNLYQFKIVVIPDNTVYWKNNTNDADHVGVYISNVKIVKD